MTMKSFRLTLCGLTLLALVGCGGGGGEANRTATQEPLQPNSAPARATGGATTNGSVAQARATVSTDGLLFVGADTAKVGDTIQLSITNEESGPVDVTLVDPTGQTVAHAQVAASATGQISASVDTVGQWTVKFDEDTAGDDLTKVITVK